jgi:NAD+ synthetase
MSEKTVQVALAQINSKVGAIKANVALIKRTIMMAKAKHADIVVFPELALCGYPPEDLVLRPEFIDKCQAALEDIIPLCHDITVVLGIPFKQQGKLLNGAVVIQNAVLTHRYAKQKLPNYGVFDEVRYFAAGEGACVFNVKGLQCGLIICEDGWFPEPGEAAKAAGAEVLIQINASPFEKSKLIVRERTLRQRAKELNIPIISVYSVGGQDDIVFDGTSMAVDALGDKCHQSARFVESVESVHIAKHQGQWRIEPQNLSAPLSTEEELYQALCLALKDYVHKNNFGKVWIGLSGGIDSALTLAIAVDALGKDKVEAVLMPSRYTSDLSNLEAIAQANAMGVKYRIISIEPTFHAFQAVLKDSFSDKPADLAEENLQSRCRGMILMALSNKLGGMVLTTSNKSEVAVGYSTLYGDMAGGYAILKDIWKTEVYQLAHYRNSLSQVIPEAVIHRAPSAELRPNQTDQDSLPDYAVLDGILQRYVEQDLSADDIKAAGFDPGAVDKAIALLKRSEYKRRQAPLGPKMSTRLFGRDWRYPVSAEF